MSHQVRRRGEAGGTGAGPQYGLWEKAFELAVSIFKVVDRIPAELGLALPGQMRLAALAIPSHLSYSRSRRSPREYARGLGAAIHALTELESQVSLCCELGYAAEAEERRLVSAIRDLKRGATWILRSVRSSLSENRLQALSDGIPTLVRDGKRDGGVERGRRERGSALILTVLVSAVLTTLGLVYLAIADTEQQISSSDRNSEQILHTAESGLRMVKAWFDQPVTGDPAASSQIMHRFLGLYDLRDPAFYDRTRRRFDHDADTATPPVLADGTAARPYYRQGRTLWAPSAYLDLFHKPYRGDATTTFMGTAREPDILIEDRPNVVDFIDVLNAALFTRQEHTGRISRIAIYAPPRISFAGTVRPAGIATVEVVVAKYRRLAMAGTVPVVIDERLKLAELRVQMVLAEVPATAANGPLESCGTLDASGGLEARWGRVLARGAVALPSDLDGGIRSAFPYRSIDRRISGDLPGDDFYEWMNAPDDVVEDPWLKIVSGGEIAGMGALGGQPFPHDPNAAIGVDHSNLFQRIDASECAALGYEPLKTASASGEEHARYFAWDPATGLFKEDGAGAARSLRDWTHGEEGLFFFDTRDGHPPNGHGPGDPLTNLTPAVVIEDTDWAFSGLLYLNAESILIRNVGGASRVVVPPGEPFDDADRDGLYDAGEAFANLYYPTTLVLGVPGSEITKSTGATQTGTATSPDLESYAFTTTVGRDPQGIPILAAINMFGVLFNAGDVVAEGPARHFGSLIAGHAVVQGAPGAPAPETFFDERLDTGLWPPAEVSFPRTFVTLWSGAI